MNRARVSWHLQIVVYQSFAVSPLIEKKILRIFVRKRTGPHLARVLGGIY